MLLVIALLNHLYFIKLIIINIDYFIIMPNNQISQNLIVKSNFTEINLLSLIIQIILFIRLFIIYIQSNLITIKLITLIFNNISVQINLYFIVPFLMIIINLLTQFKAF